MPILLIVVSIFLRLWPPVTGNNATVTLPGQPVAMLESSNLTSATIDANITPPIQTESRFNKYESPLNSLQNNGKIEKQKEIKGLFDVYHPEEKTKEPVPCTCGVFLSGQFKKGSKDQPKGVPVLTQETDTPFMNNAVGNRQCTNKCLELVRIFY